MKRLITHKTTSRANPNPKTTLIVLIMISLVAVNNCFELMVPSNHSLSGCNHNEVIDYKNSKDYGILVEIARLLVRGTKYQKTFSIKCVKE
jgi:hypothetical protein